MDNRIPTWEESSPVAEPTTTAAPAVPRWEDSAPVEDRAFGITKFQRDTLRRTFSGEPLAFIDNPELRRDFEFQILKGDDPETEKKKWALAAFFAQMRREDVRFCYGNLPTFIEKFNNNKPQSVDSAYNDIVKTLNPPEKSGLGSRIVAKGEESLASGAKTILNQLALFARSQGTKAGYEMQRADIFAEALGVTKPEQSIAHDKGFPERVAKISEDWFLDIRRKYYDPIVEDAAKRAEVPDDWVTNSDGLADWVGNLTVSVLGYIPQLAMQTGVLVTGGIPALSGMIGIDKHYELLENNPEMTPAMHVLNVAGTAIVNGLAEKVTLGIIKGPGAKKALSEGIKKGLLPAFAYFGKAGLKGGGSEMAEAFSENIIDILTGARGDTSNWAAKDWWSNLRRGVYEEGMIGFFSEAPLGGDSYRSLRQQFDYNTSITHMVEAERNRLLAVENPTDADIQELSRVESILDAGNQNAIAAVADKLALKEELAELTKREAEAELTEEELLRQKDGEAQIDYAVRQVMPHNPLDTIDAAREIMTEFPAFKLDIVYDSSELSPEIAAEIEARGHSLDRTRAWVDDSDAVHLIAANVSPSDVAKTIGHEIIGHKGLRAVFGEHFDNLLDLVYRDHFTEIAKLESTYHRDTETVEGQRYLTEEFLANCASAETKSVWWKELLQKIKMGLRKLPGLRNLRFTDREIEAALMRSARAMRRRDAENSSIGAGLRLDAAAERLTGEPVASVPSNAIRKGNGKTAIEAAMEWVEQHFSAPVQTEIGTVEVDATAIKESLSHSIYQNKLDAIQAIGDVLEHGVYLGSAPDKDGKPITNYYFAAPVKIGDTKKLVFVRTRHAEGRNNRFYVHEVFTEDEIKKLGSQQTDAPPEKTGRLYRNASEFYRSIIASVMNVNPESEKSTKNSGIKFSVAPPTDSPEFKKWFGDSKVVDENGKPLVVYHHSGNKFNVFDLSRARTSMEIPAFFFDPDSERSREYGNNVIAAYLSISNPKINHRWKYGVTDDAGTQERNKLIAAGYDGLICMEDGEIVEYAAFYPEQIKSATNNNGSYDTNNPDIRYSLAEYSEADQRDIVAMLRPEVGVAAKADVDYSTILAGKGVKISRQDALHFALEAAAANARAAKARGVKTREDWLYANIPEYAFMVDQAGPDFRIDPGYAHKGEEFTGTFIAWKTDKKGKTKAAEGGIPLDALARIIAVNHFILPTLMQFTNDLLRSLTGIRPEPYHPFGLDKLRRLGRSVPEAEKIPDEGNLERYRRLNAFCLG